MSLTRSRYAENAQGPELAGLIFRDANLAHEPRCIAPPGKHDELLRIAGPVAQGIEVDRAPERHARGRRLEQRTARNHVPVSSDDHPRNMTVVQTGEGRLSRQRPPETRCRLNDTAFGTLADGAEPNCAAYAVTSEKWPEIRRLAVRTPRADQVPQRTSRDDHQGRKRDVTAARPDRSMDVDGPTQWSLLQAARSRSTTSTRQAIQ